MIISQTPYRLSFFGGGTDYPAWFRENGGAVLSTAINKYCYLTCRHMPPFFPTKHRIVWSHIELPPRIEEILHPAVRNALLYLGFNNDHGIEIHHQGDLPARSGTGSSSAFAVGLIKALLAMRGEMINAQDLATKAIELEQNVLKENVGCQDQIATAFGGLNKIIFLPNGDFRVEPVILSNTRHDLLEDSILLFYTGTSRLSSEIAGDLISSMKQNSERLMRMRGMVNEAVSILGDPNADLDEFGRLLHEAWKEKRQLGARVSNETIDTIYETAIKAGALGGKLMGAGSSGFMFFYVPLDRQAEVKEALKHLLHVPFRFASFGSSIIHYRPHD